MTSSAGIQSKTPNPDLVDCDVLILGSGLAGSTLGSILAKAGLDVALVDAASHPRFAIGESMVPQLVAWLEILAARYEIPELHALTSIKAATEQISNTFGIKRHFGFMLHRLGEEPDPKESNQFVIPDVLTSASHLYRQDSDAYMFRVAVQYGCKVRQGWRAADVDFDDDGVTVTDQSGAGYRARYLVDASGVRSPLAQKFDLREQPARFKHHARSIFTHMVGVPRFDDVIDHPKKDRPPAPWHEGTMHHMFDRGWFWIIPFDNYKDSRNPLCSVGVTLDERTYPKPRNMSAEEDFYDIANRFPAVARQLADAKSVREWVSTERLQYSSKHSIGPRWCLMSHAAGFLDPLFSRGLSNTFEIINSLAWRVIEACKDDDFAVEKFSYVEELEQGLLNYNDELVNCSYISFSHFNLWDKVFRVWGMSSTPAAMRLTSALGRYNLNGRDESFLKGLEDVDYPGLWWPDSSGLKKVMDIMVESCEKYEIGEMEGDAAADRIMEAIQQSEITPVPLGWKDPDKRFIYPGVPQMVKFLYWASMSEQPEVRTLGRDTVRGIGTAALHGKKFI